MKGNAKIEALRTALKSGALSLDEVKKELGEHQLRQFNERLAKAAQTGEKVRFN